MEHSINQVARLAGVSSRTLRHYDDIGLLRPARVAANGYRWYGRAELLRLQRILLLKELDVPLPEIGQILTGQADELTALREHRDQLARERDRLDQVIGTVDRTIAGLAGDQELSDEDFFTGLAEGRARLHRDLTARYGGAVDAHFEASAQVTSTWSRADHERAVAEGRDLLERMSAARTSGVHPSEAHALVAEHYQGVRALWPADAQAYHALGELIMQNADQHAIVAAVDPELPEWLSAAIKSYAADCLGYQEPSASRNDKRTVGGTI